MRQASMRKERRVAQRFLIRGAAKIQWKNATFPRDCLVTDVSDTGARLYVEDCAVPETFMLTFARDDVRRDCRVVWRLGNEIGVEFTDRAQAGFALRMTR
jgi:hypothetical protein